VKTGVRGLAGLIAVVAGLLYLGVAIPAHRALAEAQDAFGRAREERRNLQSRLTRFEMRTAAEDRATEALAAGGSAGDPVGRLRHSVVASIEGASVSGVRLAVSPGRSPVGARVQLSAEGAYTEALRLSGTLARPGSGLVLESVHLRPSPAGVALDLSGFSLAARP
jgi:hypothetical protein